LTQTFVEVV